MNAFETCTFISRDADGPHLFLGVLRLEQTEPVTYAEIDLLPSAVSFPVKLGQFIAIEYNGELIGARVLAGEVSEEAITIHIELIEPIHGRLGQPARQLKSRAINVGAPDGVSCVRI